MAERSYRWLLITLAVVGLSADQVSKYGVFRWLYNSGEFTTNVGYGNSRQVVDGWFELIAQNTIKITNMAAITGRTPLSPALMRAP